MPSHVRNGSDSDFDPRNREVRFITVNGHRRPGLPGPKSANSGRPQEWDECPFSASIVTGCQRKLHERPYCAVPSTAFTFTMKLLWIRICFIAGNCMTVCADVGPRIPTM